MGKPKGGKGTKGGKGRAGVKGKFATQNVYTPEERSQAYLVNAERVAAGLPLASITSICRSRRRSAARHVHRAGLPIASCCGILKLWMPGQQSTQNTTQSFSLKSLRVTATSQLAQLVCTTCGKQGILVLAKSKTPHSLCLQSSSYLGFALYKTAKLNTTVLLAALSYPAFSH